MRGAAARLARMVGAELEAKMGAVAMEARAAPTVGAELEEKMGTVEVATVEVAAASKLAHFSSSSTPDHLGWRTPNLSRRSQ